MTRAKEKKTIFEEMKGCHERQFVSIPNHISPSNSKYKRETFFSLETGGREKVQLGETEDEEQREYFPNRNHYLTPLNKGYVSFKT